MSTNEQMNLPLGPEPAQQGKPEPRRLIDLNVERAAKIKFQRGQEEHGVLFTADAVEEMYSECLDGMNYCDEAVNQGYEFPKMHTMRAQFKRMAKQCQAEYTRRHSGGSGGK